MNSDRYDVVVIRPGQRGVLAHGPLDSHGDAFKRATEEWEGLKKDRANQGTEVRTIRTDRWGEAHVSGRLYV